MNNSLITYNNELKDSLKTAIWEFHNAAETARKAGDKETMIRYRKNQRELEAALDKL